MPQNPIPTTAAPGIPQNVKSVLNVTSSTLVKAAPATVLQVQVISAGTTNGGLYDATTVSGAAAANQFAVINGGTAVTPGAVTGLTWTTTSGLVAEVGSGQVIAINYV